MCLSRIKGPFQNYDFACTVIPVSSRAAKLDDVMDLELGKVRASTMSLREQLKRLISADRRSLEAWCSTRLAEYCLFYSGSCDPTALFIIK